MENIEENVFENKNTYVEKISELDSEYKDKSLFPVGKIETITYSMVGKVMGIRLSSDVPTNFSPAEIVVVHPDNDNEGWVGKGNIGFIVGVSGVDISKIPLPEETIGVIKEIYKKYTGKESQHSFNRENNINKLAIMGLYNDIASSK